MNISKRFFFFSKSVSRRSVMLGASFYISEFYTVKLKGVNVDYKAGNYKYCGWGIAISLTIFENEMVLGLVPYNKLNFFRQVQPKFSDRIHGK